MSSKIFIIFSVAKQNHKKARKIPQQFLTKPFTKMTTHDGGNAGKWNVEMRIRGYVRIGRVVHNLVKINDLLAVCLARGQKKSFKKTPIQIPCNKITPSVYLKRMAEPSHFVLAWCQRMVLRFDDRPVA